MGTALSGLCQPGSPGASALVRPCAWMLSPDWAGRLSPFDRGLAWLSPSQSGLPTGLPLGCVLLSALLSPIPEPLCLVLHCPLLLPLWSPHVIYFSVTFVAFLCPTPPELLLDSKVLDLRDPCPLLTGPSPAAQNFAEHTLQSSRPHLLL